MVYLAVLTPAQFFCVFRRLLYPYWAGGLADRKETRAAIAKMFRDAGDAHQGQGGASCVSTGLPTKAEHRGPVFHLGCHQARQRLPMPTILDEWTRECHVFRADRALKSSGVLEVSSGPSPGTVRPPGCEVPMVPSLSPRKSGEGWPATQDDLYRAPRSVAKWLR